MRVALWECGLSMAAAMPPPRWAENPKSTKCSRVTTAELRVSGISKTAAWSPTHWLESLKSETPSPACGGRGEGERERERAERLLGCEAELRRMGKWASTGCSKATHKHRVATITGSGAAEADRWDERWGNRPLNTVRGMLVKVCSNVAIV